MQIKWIEDFLILTDAHAFSRAAERRNVSQPTFSRHIQALEEWLGVELIDRRMQGAQQQGGLGGCAGAHGRLANRVSMQAIASSRSPSSVTMRLIVDVLPEGSTRTASPGLTEPLAIT